MKVLLPGYHPDQGRGVGGVGDLKDQDNWDARLLWLLPAKQ